MAKTFSDGDGGAHSDAEIARLRAALEQFVDHFGPLEDNHMLHEGARKCFRLAREALGPQEHDRIIANAED